jgi:hypothetical protein
MNPRVYRASESYETNTPVLDHPTVIFALSVTNTVSYDVAAGWYKGHGRIHRLDIYGRKQISQDVGSLVRQEQDGYSIRNLLPERPMLWDLLCSLERMKYFYNYF